MTGQSRLHNQASKAASVSVCIYSKSGGFQPPAEILPGVRTRTPSISWSDTFIPSSKVSRLVDLEVSNRQAKPIGHNIGFPMARALQPFSSSDARTALQRGSSRSFNKRYIYAAS